MPQLSPSIALIICYFGAWPSWFPFFLATCRANPSIDWLFFTDCPPPAQSSANTHFIPFTLDDFNRTSSNSLGLQVEVKHPYKLCDLRPAFGHIFAEQVADYTFWGHTDLDVVYGNLRTFLPDAVLTNHDVITARRAYLSGHFTLYRNTPTINALYQASPDYARIFESEAYMNFDECASLWMPLLRGEPLNTLPTSTVSMTHVVQQQAAEGHIRTHCGDALRERFELHHPTFRLLWDNGTLHDVDRDEALMYFHFHTIKRQARFRIPDWPDIPSRFLITDNGFERV